MLNEKPGRKLEGALAASCWEEEAYFSREVTASSSPAGSKGLNFPGQSGNSSADTLLETVGSRK